MATEIVYEKEDNKTTVGKMKNGECFIFSEILYMKVALASSERDKVLCVNSGGMVLFSFEHETTVVDIKIIVKGEK
jgi:hypothetical protein